MPSGPSRTCLAVSSAVHMWSGLQISGAFPIQTSQKNIVTMTIRAVPDFGSGRNPTVFQNPAPAKNLVQPDFWPDLENCT